MRAILAPYDKSGLVEFARGLHSLGWELFVTGGTERALTEAGVPVTAVAELTGSPEMLGGRVKTLHPKVHGGLLYRRGHAGDEAEIAEHGIQPIDLVASNLYPFVETVTSGDVSLAEASASSARMKMNSGIANPRPWCPDRAFRANARSNWSARRYLYSNCCRGKPGR